VGRLTEYARSGGHLILTCRTGQKDRRGHLWDGPWAAPILDLIGGALSGYDVLPAPIEATVKAGDKNYNWGVWGDRIEPRAGTTVLARYADQFYAGKAAAVTRKLGNGSVTYIGVESLAGDLERDLVRDVFERAGVAAERFDPDLQVNWNQGFFVAANYGARRQAVPIPAGARILVGARELDPAGVVIWTEK
jgi:beta-galactosidase